MQVDVPLELRADRTEVPTCRVPLPVSHLTQQAATDGNVGVLCEPPGALPPATLAAHGRKSTGGAASPAKPGKSADQPPFVGFSNASFGQTDASSGVQRPSLMPSHSYPPANTDPPIAGQSVSLRPATRLSQQGLNKLEPLVSADCASGQTIDDMSDDSVSESDSGEYVTSDLPSAATALDGMQASSATGERTLSSSFQLNTALRQLPGPSLRTPRMSAFDTAAIPGEQTMKGEQAATAASFSSLAAQQGSVQNAALDTDAAPKKALKARVSAMMNLGRAKSKRKQQQSAQPDDAEDGSGTAKGMRSRPSVSFIAKTQASEDSLTALTSPRSPGIGARVFQRMLSRTSARTGTSEMQTGSDELLEGSALTSPRRASQTLKGALGATCTASKRHKLEKDGRRNTSKRHDAPMLTPSASAPPSPDMADPTEQSNIRGLQFRLAAQHEHRSSIRIALSMSDIKMLAPDNPMPAAPLARSEEVQKTIVVGIKECRGLKVKITEAAAVFVKLAYGDKKLQTDAVSVFSDGSAHIGSVFQMLQLTNRNKVLEFEVRQANNACAASQQLCLCSYALLR